MNKKKILISTIIPLFLNSFENFLIIKIFNVSEEHVKNCSRQKLRASNNSYEPLIKLIENSAIALPQNAFLEYTSGRLHGIFMIILC